MRALWGWFRSRRTRTQIGLAVGALFVMLIIVGALSPSPEETTPGDRAAKLATQSPTAPATRSARPPHTARPRTTARAKAKRSSSSSRNALIALQGLPVKGRAPKTGYGREQFGDGWASVAGRAG